MLPSINCVTLILLSLLLCGVNSRRSSHAYFSSDFRNYEAVLYPSAGKCQYTSGAFVADQWVVAVRHCVDQPNISVRVEQGKYSSKALALLLHPTMNVALLKVNRISEDIVPIPLPPSNLNSLKNERVNVTMFQLFGPPEGMKMQRDFNRVTSDEDCQKAYPNKSMADYLCTTFWVDAEKHPCAVSVGSPLVLTSKRVLLALCHYTTKACGKHLQLFVRMAPVSKWIEDQMASHAAIDLDEGSPGNSVN